MPSRRTTVGCPCPPSSGAVRVADRHAHDHDRMHDRRQRRDARESAGRCGRSPIRGRLFPRARSGSGCRRRRFLRRDRGCSLEAQPAGPHGCRRPHCTTALLRPPPLLQREVEADPGSIANPEHRRIQRAQRLLKELLLRSRRLRRPRVAERVSRFRGGTDPLHRQNHTASAPRANPSARRRADHRA